MEFILATRGSKLALTQAELVQSVLSLRFPDHHWKIQTIVTTGDRIQDRSLSEFGGKGVFLKEIEEALLRQEAHLAVHSLKDVPALETSGLHLAAFLPREDPRDVWASYQEDLMLLPSGKIVGTSSLRRTLLIKLFRPDLKVELLRGNIDTRLRKLKEGDFDAIVLAAAGLHRLGLFSDSFMHYLSEDAFIPAIGQGILTIQTNTKNSELIELISEINDPLSESAALIERGLLARYEGGCHLPIGALATREREGIWKLRAFVGGILSHKIVQDVVECLDAGSCAGKMFERLEHQGASGLLQEVNERR
jgi:hydroxymethylbilane synthase